MLALLSMDENAQSFSPFYSQPESPKIYLPKPAGSTASGLTLVIPSLKSLKASQSARTPKNRSGSLLHSPSVFQDVENQEKKNPRPVKLKPLKEVLGKLISQIKKRDDYAFFLTPVNAENIPGYSDIVRRPMDFGTMTVKVNRGKYRSLEDFASDFKLVTSNAKIFNPPGSIYHAEADRIEAWGLDHISKAASTVIQYETDWNIDVEKDDEGLSVNVDDDEDSGAVATMDMDNSSLRERSVSVASQPQQGLGKRGPRGPYRKQGQTALATGLSEALEPEGGLPGSKDGIGAFPPGSDWAKTMVALKLKGKRYKTKKERLRFEREGPPLHPDGSLNYTEMEEPFSVLSFFVAEPLSRPQLVPLYPPLYNPQPPAQVVSDPSSSQTPQPQPPPSRPSTFPSATILPPDHVLPTLPFLQPANFVNSSRSSRRHWVINRNAASRQKGKDKEDDQEVPELPQWQTPRDAEATDFGSFAVLAGALAEEMRRRGLTSSSLSGVGMEIKENIDHEVNFDLIRNSLHYETAVKKEVEESSVGLAQTLNATSLLTKGYWTTQRAAEAEEYLRDMVYGGVDGFAYARSLGEFVNSESYYQKEPSDSPLGPPHYQGLGIPLSQWVVENIIDPLTEERHSLLRETAIEVIRQQHYKPPSLGVDPREGTVASQVTASLHLYPSTLIALSALLHIRLHKIDMGSLLKTPQELFISEEEWAGKGLKEKRRQRMMKAKQEVPNVTGGLPDDAMEVEEPEQTWVGMDANLVNEKTTGRLTDYELEGPEELNEVLKYVADAILKFDQRNRAEKIGGGGLKSVVNGQLHTNGATTEGVLVPTNGTVGQGDSRPSQQILSSSSIEQATQPAEDPILRNLRLNLLALAKRAPLDTIARLPKDLVPEHIRHFVPTLGSTC